MVTKLRWLLHEVLLLCGLLASGCGLIFAPKPTPTDPAGMALAATATAIEALAGILDRGDVNLSHLNFLVEDVEIAGQPMAITHIYSEYPRYEWVDASGEGIAAVDLVRYGQGRNLQIWMDVGTLDDLLEDNRRIIALLDKRQYNVIYRNYTANGETKLGK